MNYQHPDNAAAHAPEQPADFISRDDMGLSAAYSAPRTEIERTLADIWSSVLAVTPIGIDDDFFELGGDSFAATVVASQIEANLDVAFSPANIIHHSTVASQAEHLADQGAETVSDLPSFIVPCNGKGTKRPLFLVHGGAGYTFFGPEFFNTIGEDQPVYMIEALGLDGRNELCDTVEEIAGIYLKAIRQVQPEGPYRIGASCTGSFICLEICDQIGKGGEQIEKLILIDPPLRIAENRFPKLRGLSELGQYPHLLRRWFRAKLAGLMSRVDFLDYVLSERNRMRKQRKRRKLFEERQKGGDVRTEERAYNLDAMVDASVGLNQALRNYRVKNYDGHADMLVSGQRAFNASPESLYSNKIRSISCKTTPASHKSLFEENSDQMAAFIRSALRS